MKQPDDRDPHYPPGTRPPDYVIVVSASDWIKDHFPAAGTNLWDALHTGKERNAEPDLEAEP